MARVYGAMTGSEPLPDLTPLYASNVTEGELRGLLVPTTLSPRWDPIDGERPVDHGDVGVDKKGVYVRRHPDLVLTEMPEAAAVIDAWRRGQNTITPEDDDNLTCFELDLKMIMAAAASRRRGGAKS